MTRDMQESMRLLDSKTEEALKGAVRQVEKKQVLAPYVLPFSFVYDDVFSGVGSVEGGCECAVELSP